MIKFLSILSRCEAAEFSQQAAAPPDAGMMLHQDRSSHEWLAGRPKLDLIVTMDDATGVIY